MASYTKADLQFILTQIKYAEADVAGDTDINLVDLIPHPDLPYGIRTVDGTQNNLRDGQDEFGASDNTFPRLLDPIYRPAENSPTGFGPIVSTSYAQTAGLVFDSQPRTISNLIANQTISNAAAVAAALRRAGSEDPAGNASTLIAANNVAKAAASALVTAQQNATDANAALAAAQSGNSAVLQALTLAQGNNTTAQNAKTAAQTALDDANAAATLAAAELQAATVAEGLAQTALTNATNTYNAAVLADAAADTQAATDAGLAATALQTANDAAAAASAATAAAATALAGYNAAVNLFTNNSPAVAAAFAIYDVTVQATVAANLAVTQAQSALTLANGTASTSAQALTAANAAAAAALAAQAAAVTTNGLAQNALTTANANYQTAQNNATAAADDLLAANLALGTANQMVIDTEAQYQVDLLAFGELDLVTIASKLAAEDAVAEQEIAVFNREIAFAADELAQDNLTAADGQLLVAQTAADDAFDALAQANADLTTANTQAATAATQAATDAGVAATAQTAYDNAVADAATATSNQNAALPVYESTVAGLVAGDSTVIAAQNAYNQAVDDAQAAAQAAADAQTAYDTANATVATSAQAAQDAQDLLDDALAEKNNAQTAFDDAQALVETETNENQAAQNAIAPAQTDLDAATLIADGTAAALQTAEDAATAGNTGLSVAIDNDDAATAALGNAQSLANSTATNFDTLVENYGLEIAENGSILIVNKATDEGLSAQYNSWFTLFGQFFDHGLDLVTKGRSGTVFIPLKPDDPLYVEGSNSNFMVLSRTTNQPGADGVLGTADDVREATNTTTPFVDQNQTYSSHPSHQVFLREYELDAGVPKTTGRLIENRDLGDDGIFGSSDDVYLGGMATWAVVKAQARDILGINLTDADVNGGPLLATDDYGNFIPGANGMPQIVTAAGLVEGVIGSAVSTAAAVRGGYAFLDDIAHSAAPRTSSGVLKTADADNVVGGTIAVGTYDNELLDAHYIAGDGRVNENIGLTAIHNVFHSEHNRMVEHTKDVVLASNDLAFINEWLDGAPLTALPTLAEVPNLDWNGERLFQSAKFGTEMQYQHLVFEEFARKIQPQVDIFVGYDGTINPAIVAEFAHVVYRFGHSQLNETVDRYDSSFGLVNGDTEQITLIDAFLNPLEFANSGLTHAEATGAIARGMTRQAGNEIDEFVSEALRSNLVGLPLDLAALNIARGRETGVPGLNAARRDFFTNTGDAQLKPYESWVDFANNVRNPESVINFIAAYGTHAALTASDVDTLADKRAVATALVLGGDAVVNEGLPNVRTFTANEVDRLDFLSSAGLYANLANGVTTTGVDAIDFWMGGLAERQMPFGGLLGSTFNFVFETQLEQLQDGDRFYYLARTAGLNFLSELEGNSFAGMIMRNSDATHLPGDVFSVPNFILEVDQTKQFTGLGFDGRADPTGGTVFTPLIVRNNPSTVGTDTNYLKFTGGEHVVLGGTEGDDILIASIGDDTIWGDGGDDRIEGGDGVDILNGGDGNDIITDLGGDDNIKGGDGDDVISGGNGFDLIIAGSGSDFVVAGEDPKEIFANQGNDFVMGGSSFDTMIGDQGSDWLEGGGQGDFLVGDLGSLFEDGTEIGHDVLIGGTGTGDEFHGEAGDDVMVMADGTERAEGMFGFDWSIHKGQITPVNADFDNTLALPVTVENFADRFGLVEGLSGWDGNDVLRGDSVGELELLTEGLVGNLNTNNAINNAEQIALIDGLQALLDGALGAGQTSFSGGNIILGGGGSDTIEGRGGDDLINGDAWLNVRIKVTGHPTITSAENMAQISPYLFSGEIKPSQLSIVREILTTSSPTDVDTAVFSGNFSEYTVSQNVNGSISVSHTAPATNNVDDGTDTLVNIEQLQFTDRLVTLAPPSLDLSGNITSNVRDQFGTQSYANNNGSVNWAGNWAETGDDNSVKLASGQIRVINGQLQFDSGNTPAASNGASVQRVVNLNGASSATLSFNYSEINLDAGETVLVQFAADGTNFSTLQTVNSASNTGAANIALTGPFSANSTVRFVVSAMSLDTDRVNIDNVNIAFTTTPQNGNDYATTYTENATAIAITSSSIIQDGAGATISSARVVLTNAQAGDVMSIAGVLPAGIVAAINTAVAGQVSVNLSGEASLIAYQTAIQAIRFASTSEVGGNRIVNSTVNDGVLNSNIAVTTIAMSGVNDAPVISTNGAGATATISINENTTAVTTVIATDVDLPAQTLTYGLAGGDDAARFTIDAVTGALSFIAPPDFELPTDTSLNLTNTYHVNVSVSDGITTDTQAIRVNVLNVNEVAPNVAPVITSNGGGVTAAINFAENGTAAVTVVTATDADLPAQTLTYTKSGADAALFNINATTGALSFINAPNFEAPTDAGGNNTYDVIVQVSDGVATDSQAIAVTVTDVNEVAPNVAPVITSNLGGATAAINFAENGTAAVTIVTATDADLPAQTLTYTKSGADAALFNINATTGALSFINAPNFEAPTDVGANNIYDVIVQVSDGIATDSQAIAVTVTDVVEVVTNNPLTGSLHITGYTTNQVAFQDSSTNLTATNTINDPDGMTNNVPYQWQQLVSGVWQNIVGATNAVLANQSNNTVRVTSSYTDPFGSYNFISAETAYITGTVADNTIIGSTGNDYLLGLGGFDVLTGGAGDDTIDGGTGGDNFMATAGDGNDVYKGGDGVDRYNLSQTSANVTINLTTGTASGADTGLDTLAGIEIVLGGDGNNTITDGALGEQMYGRGGNDTLIMTADNARDRIDTGVGTDTIDYSAFTTNLTVALNGFNEVSVGGSGSTISTNDIIAAIDNFVAGAGNDTIAGDSFNNQLTGGLGTDTLTGGLGADTFKYTNANQSTVGALHDVITDFLSGTDKLDFSAIDANAATAGEQAFSFNNTAGAAISGAGQLVFSYVGAGASEMTVIQGNLDNNLGADFEVALMGHITFNPATDIIA